MASHGTVKRSSATTTTSTSPTLPTIHSHEPKVRPEFSPCFSFNIPKTPEAATARIIRNLSCYRLYYTLFIWIIFFITLVPKRKHSLIFSVAMTALTYSFLALMRLVPADSVVLQYKIIDRRLVLGLMAVATVVQLIGILAAIPGLPADSDFQQYKSMFLVLMVIAAMVGLIVICAVPVTHLVMTLACVHSSDFVECISED